MTKVIIKLDDDLYQDLVKIAKRNTIGVPSTIYMLVKSALDDSPTPKMLLRESHRFHAPASAHTPPPTPPPPPTKPKAVKEVPTLVEPSQLLSSPDPILVTPTSPPSPPRRRGRPPIPIHPPPHSWWIANPVAKIKPEDTILGKFPGAKFRDAAGNLYDAEFDPICQEFDDESLYGCGMNVAGSAILDIKWFKWNETTEELRAAARKRATTPIDMIQFQPEDFGGQYFDGKRLVKGIQGEGDL